MSELFAIFISTCLVNNLVLNHLLGLPPGIALSRRINVALGLSAAMVLVLTLTAVASYGIEQWLLAPLQLAYLRALALLLGIGLVVALLDGMLRMLQPAWHERLAVFLPLTCVNSAVMGTAMMSTGQAQGFARMLCFGLGSGVGYGLVMTMLAALEQRLAVADIPAPFRGISIILITLGIMSMAFMGFSGLVTG